ncbi:MAG: heparinase, partial [Methylocella sp.]
REGRSVLCVLPDGRRWLFEATAGRTTVEDSIFFAAPDGPRSCAQIVVHDESRASMIIEWSFCHVERKPPRDEA